jgi:hypothetical protein
MSGTLVRMKCLFVVVLFCPILAAQTTPKRLPSVFVAAKSNSSSVAVPMMIGPAPLVIATAGNAAKDIDYFIRKRCDVAVTVKSEAEADFILTPNGKAWDLKDKAGTTVFTTKAKQEANTAKDVCGYFKG